MRSNPDQPDSRRPAGHSRGPVMDDDQLDVPWLKIIAEGFLVGSKWVVVSLVAELPVLFGMIFGLVSVEEGVRMAVGILACVAGMGVLFAVLGTIYVAYYKYRWARYLVLTAFVLFFGLPIMTLVLAPYAAIWGFIFQPLDISWPAQVLVVGGYAAFMYWWTRVQYEVFIEYNALSRLWGWISKTANETSNHRLKLRKLIARGLD